MILDKSYRLVNTCILWIYAYLKTGKGKTYRYQAFKQKEQSKLKKQKTRP